MVWAAIGRNFKSPLVFFDETINAETYQKMLKENKIFDKIKQCFNGSEVYFQQDGAKPHTAKSTIKYIEEEIKLIRDLPLNSPAISPIEMLWAILKRIIAERQPKTLDELRTVLVEEWEKLPMVMINNLIESIPNRLKMVAENNGKQIGYLIRKAHNVSCKENLKNASTDPPDSNEQIHTDDKTVLRLQPIYTIPKFWEPRPWDTETCFWSKEMEEKWIMSEPIWNPYRPITPKQGRKIAYSILNDNSLLIKQFEYFDHRKPFDYETSENEE
jgi:hypothetical protein